jgi:predicted transcriptional regulator
MIYDKLSFEILHVLYEEKRTTFTNLQSSVVFNPRTLSKKLKILIEKKLLNKEGNIYKITDRGLIFFEVYQTAIFLLHGFCPEIDSLNVPILIKLALQEYIKIISNEFKDKLVCIILFGSIATGTWNETSDIDLALFFQEITDISQLFEQFTTCRRKFRATHNYRSLIQKHYSFRVQHVPFSVKETKKFHNLYPDLITTGIKLYDPNGFYNGFKEQVIKKIKQKKLIKVSNMNGRHYWKKLTEVS